MHLTAPKTRMIGLSDGEDRMILAGLFSPQLQRVIDGQTDGRTAYGYRALHSIN